MLTDRLIYQTNKVKLIHSGGGYISMEDQGISNGILKLEMLMTNPLNMCENDG